MEMNLKETIPAEELKKRQMDLPHLTERMKQQSDDAVLMVQKNTNIENPQLFNIFPARNIKTVIFKDTLADAPNTASDLSEKQNRSVLGWMENDTLYLAGNGGVKANQDSSHLFNFCTELERIEFNYCFDTSNVTNMHSMFYYCSSLTSLDVSGFNTANVTDMSFMFNKCEVLSFLDVSGFDTAKVTDMNTMFQECSSLTFLDVSGFDTSNVTAMDFMFNKCGALAFLDVSGFNTSKVTITEAMFKECSSLTSLDVSRFDTSNVTNMNAMFYYCSSLTSLDVSGFNTSNAANKKYMFDKCPNQKALESSMKS